MVLYINEKAFSLRKSLTRVYLSQIENCRDANSQRIEQMLQRMAVLQLTLRTEKVCGEQDQGLVSHSVAQGCTFDGSKKNCSDVSKMRYLRSSKKADNFKGKD